MRMTRPLTLTLPLPTRLRLSRGPPHYNRVTASAQASGGRTLFWVSIQLRALRDRVLAPAELLPAQGPTGITWRALSNADAAVIVGLSERISVREHPAWSESLDDIHEVLGHSWVDPGLDGMLALDDAGTAVAWGLVIAPPNPETLVRVILLGGVDPEHRGRGIGRRLLAWQHDRARVVFAASELAMPAWVVSYAADCAPEHGRLLKRSGFEPARYFTTLECDLAVPTPHSPIPEGLDAEQFAVELSEAVRVAKNAAFGVT